MEITVRGLWTLIHGMGFGALYLLACSGALIELFRVTAPSAPSNLTRGQEQFLKGYLVAMAVLAWSVCSRERMSFTRGTVQYRRQE
jgi:hypothetical protein